MSAVVYEAVCRVHGKSYIGQSKDFSSCKRSHAHAANHGSKSLFHRALRKHGTGAFDWQIRAELPTVEEAKIAERILIALERPAYNMSAGGDGAVGVKHTPEQSAKQRARMLQFRHSEAAKAKIGLHHRGKVVSQETRAKLSAAAKSRDLTKHPMLGRTQSSETRAKISETKRRRNAERKLTAARAAGEVK